MERRTGPHLALQSQDFLFKLKRHLLPQLIALLGYDLKAEQEWDWTKVAFEGDRIYSHKTMRITYGTYDLRQATDVIHVKTQQCNVMLLNGAFRYGDTSGSEEPPYLYARVLGIFHVNASYVGHLPDGKINLGYHRIDFAWIHWYDSLSHGTEFKLDRVSLHPLHSESEQGLDFIDPSFILRAVHIIPRFASKPLNTLTPPSELVPTQQLWKEYYINK